jgi:hypothetical protein
MQLQDPENLIIAGRKNVSRSQGIGLQTATAEKLHADIKLV